MDWAIIGGGIHGVHMAARLIGDGAVAPERLRIIDPADRLLLRWRKLTAITGMTHLRSASVHHLDLCPSSLQQFAGRKRRRSGAFAAPYRRPALELFNAHCDQVVDRFGLDALHLRTRAEWCQVRSDGVSLTSSDGRRFEAKNVVLAMGGNEKPAWPTWAPLHDSRVQHVFAADFEGWPRPGEAVAVVGGGISAVQVALRLFDEGGNVHLVSRHALRQHQFDSDPGWLGPKYMARYSRERDFDRRREMITLARNRGSVPPDVRVRLRRAVEAGLGWHEREVRRLEAHPDTLVLHLEEGLEVRIDRVLLATGFRSQRPGGEMVDRMISDCSLDCAACGYPIVDTALRWHPRVFVAGPLAELELGPVARNIAGARRAADRLVPVAQAN